jgi:hypothetical protein
MKLRLALLTTLAVTGYTVAPATAQAATTGSISGTVTESTVPVADVFVAVLGTVDHGIFGKGPGLIADTTTDASGHYSVVGLPPSTGRGYWVCFVPDDWPFGRYDSQCFDQADGFAALPSGSGFFWPPIDSKQVPLTAGQHRAGTDADVQPVVDSTSGRITGKVTVLGLLPLRHATVTVSQDGTTAGATFSATNGTYRVTGLAPGSYRVCFDGSTAGKYSSTCRRALVPVNAGAATKGINGALSIGR